LPKKENITAKLERIADTIRLSFTATDATRERALHLCREIIRYSATAIRTVHRQEIDKAKNIVASTSKLVEELNNEIRNSRDDFLSTGFVHNAQKEFAEACITIAVVAQEQLPDPEKIFVTYPAYLNGLGEAAGELRRYVLDCLRRNDFSRCEELLSIMDDIYTVLTTIDFPDAITCGLRRTTDSVRGMLEKTRGDLTIALRQKSLENRINSIING